MIKTTTSLLLGALAGVIGLSASADIESRVEYLLFNADLRGTDVSVCVSDVSRDEMLAEINADEPMMPASNMKLVTTATALHILGPDFRFTTKLSMIAADTAPGETGLPALVVTGDGDPSFGDPATLDEAGYIVDDMLGWWLDAVEATGQTHFGELLIDDRIFENGPEERVHPTWPENQLHRHYCAQVMGINFVNNTFQVTATPQQPGEDVLLAIYPKGDFVSTNLRVTTGRIDQWDIITSADNNQITFRGQLRHKQRAYVSMHDPAMIFGGVLRDELASRGITVDSLRRPADNEQLPESTTIHRINTTLQAVLNRTNRNSVNLYAEALLKRSGFRLTGMPGNFDNGAAAIRSFLSRILDDPTLAAAVQVADGSGMSRDNRVTTRLLIELMTAMKSSDNFAPYLESLGRPGEDGTLEQRFVGIDLAGQVHAKSGYIANVSALSGYILYPPRREGGNPRIIAFSIICNGFGLDAARQIGNSDMKRLQEAIVEIIDDEIAAPAR